MSVVVEVSISCEGVYLSNTCGSCTVVHDVFLVSPCRVDHGDRLCLDVSFSIKQFSDKS